jgi:hypothetical protein
MAIFLLGETPQENRETAAPLSLSQSRTLHGIVRYRTLDAEVTIFVRSSKWFYCDHGRGVTTKSREAIYIHTIFLDACSFYFHLKENC